MVEVLAPHAAAAFQNASLLEGERGAARAAGALLQLSQSLTGRRNAGEIFRDAIESMETIIRCAATAAYVRDGSGAYRVIQLHACGGRTVRPRAEIADVPPTLAETLLTSSASPFVVPRTVVDEVPDEIKIMSGPGDILVCPLQWEPGESGALIAVADAEGASFDDAVPASGARHRRPHGAGARQRPADQRARALPPAGREPRRGLLGSRGRHPAGHVPRRPGRRPVRRRHGGLARPAVGSPHHRRRPLARRRRGPPRDRRRRRREPGVPGRRRRRRRAVAPRSRDGRAGEPGRAAGPRAERRRHRTQARRTDAARLRAQVLGGVPARARGRAAAPRARRDEEHVPGGGVARSADAAHLDLRLGADAGAEPARDAVRPTPWTSCTAWRRTRASSSGCSAICWTSTGCNAGSCPPSVARPTSAR